MENRNKDEIVIKKSYLIIAVLMLGVAVGSFIGGFMCATLYFH